MKRQTLPLPLLLGLVVPSAVAAETLWIHCAGCNEDAFEARVPRIGPGKVAVYDLRNARMQTFEVECANAAAATADAASSTDGPGHSVPCGPPLAEVRQRLPTATETAFFDAAAEGWKASQGHMAVLVGLDATDVADFSLEGIDVYRVIEDGNMQGMLGDTLAEAPPLHRMPPWAREMIRNQHASLGFQQLLRANLVLELEDGGSVVYQYTQHTPSAKYRDGYSRTPGGQLLPDMPVRGVWTDPSATGAADDLAPLLAHLLRLGARVQRSAGERVRRIECTDATAPAIDCKAS
jgi:hypothetical protein